ncbi:MAG: response regulator, partial [Anaerolineales bacterium]|nr:response regulator [Anaerolineales bacterium]
MKQVVLLADNNQEFCGVWGTVLTNAGYEVKLAVNPQEARFMLINIGIDLAVLDVRLEDDDDELDVSGLNLATDNAFRHIPKIILTAYKPSPEYIRKLRELSADKLPSAVTWMGKDEGTDKLLEIIPQVISLWP